MRITFTRMKVRVKLRRKATNTEWIVKERVMTILLIALWITVGIWKIFRTIVRRRRWYVLGEVEVGDPGSSEHNVGWEP